MSVFLLISSVSANSNFTSLNQSISEHTSDIYNLKEDVQFISSDNESKFQDGILIDRDDFTINGNGHTVDGQGKVRIFNITGNNVKLININLINGYNFEDGGAIYNTGKNLKIENSNISNSYAASGGAIINRDSNFKIINSNFYNNSANWGGAIYNVGYKFNILGNCNFTYNKATFGGAIYNYNYDFGFDRPDNNGSDFTMNGNFYFMYNRGINTDNPKDPYGSGGAVTIFSKYAKLIGNFIFDSNLGRVGGALDIESKDAILNGTFIFKNNAALEVAGALLNTNNNLSFIGNFLFINNTVRIAGLPEIQNQTAVKFFTGGGAIYNSNGHIFINNTKFINNSCLTIYGGGGAIFNQGKITVTNSIFDNNYVNFIKNSSDSVYGGAIFNVYTKWVIMEIPAIVNIYNSNFTNNRNSKEGGAIYNYKSNLTISSSNFYNNSGNFAGVIYNNRGDVNISNSDFSLNKASRSASVLYNSHSNTTIYNSIFKNNNASASSTIANINGSIVIDISEFLNNYVINNGGVLWHHNGTTLVNNSKFINNTAKNLGGAIYLNNGLINLLNSNFDGNSLQVYVSSNGTLSLEKNIFTESKVAILNKGLITTLNYLTILSNSSHTAGIDKTFNITAILTDDNGNIIVGQNITLKTTNFNKNIDNYSITNGKYYYYHLFNKLGDFVFTGNALGLNNNIIKTGSVNVVKNNPNLNVLITPGLLEATFNISTDSKATGIISININGKNYNFTLVNGCVNEIIELHYGNYTVNITYVGDDKFLKEFIVKDLEIEFGYKPKIISENIVLFYKNGTRFEIKLIDQDGNPLKNQKLIFHVNGVNNERTTDNEGKASIAINLDPKIYTILVTFNSNGIYPKTSIVNNITVLSTISASNLVKYYRNDSQYYVSVVDGVGNPLRNADVRMNINGVFYTRQTDSNGVAKLSINLNPGDYIITVYHPLNGQEWSNNITVLPTLKGDDLITKFQSGDYYRVKLVDSVGNPIKGKNITMNINGVFYERVTDDDGFARLSINLNPNHYIITAYYDGYSTSNNIIVNEK